jgi:predicted CXXCH cytochrome family protein
LKRIPPRVALGTVSLVLLSVLAGCVDENIVYRERDLFENPLPAALGFLGYSSQRDTLPVCGNCHIESHGQWKATDHARAWETLQESGGAQDFCEGCHTVNERGNALDEPAGHTATGEERYQDVQCESCHGPGLEHVNNPNKQTLPLAFLDVDTTKGCGECHQGAHHPFVDEWAESGHGSYIEYPADRPECEGCHTGEGALRAWGVTANYAEKDGIDDPGQHVAITCAVCHDPHGSESEHQLRFPIDYPSEDVNLCMKCHQKRGEPEPDSNRGPHSPQGPTLLGTAGWFPPGLAPPIRGTHGSVEANPRLCAGCHVNAWEVVDEATGEFVARAVGHSFEATPCVDAQGAPVDGPCENVDRSYEACTQCHSEEVARGLVEFAKASIAPLQTELADLLSQVPDSEFDPDDDRYTVAEGSLFNLQLSEAGGAAVHNALLIRRLLIASIDEVRNTYPTP